MLIGFSSNKYKAFESIGHATVCVEVQNFHSGGAISPFNVSLLPEEGKYIFI